MKKTENTQPDNLGNLLVDWAAKLQPSCYRTVRSEALLAFRLWLLRMPARRAALVAGEIFSLCRRPGLDTVWFCETLQNPNPGSHSDNLVLFFGMAMHERWLSKYHLRVLEWRNAPRTRANQEFGLQLYAGLIESGFIRQPGEILLAPSARRNLIVETAILDVYHKNYSLLAALTREIMFLQERNLPFYSLPEFQNEMYR